MKSDTPRAHARACCVLEGYIMDTIKLVIFIVSYFMC